jgi:hypothetical protein
MMPAGGIAEETWTSPNGEETRGPGARETVDDDVGNGRQRVRL